jgi:hypothetical protein
MLNRGLGKPRFSAMMKRVDYFVVSVSAPPVDGKANEEIENYFSKLLKRDVKIKSGKSSKKKTITALILLPFNLREIDENLLVLRCILAILDAGHIEHLPRCNPDILIMVLVADVNDFLDA